MANSAEPSWDDLSIFLTVCKVGGFRAAARHLGLSPAHVSETVGRLEARLGIPLLTRTTRNVATTEAGRGLADRLAPLLAEARAALQDVADAQREVQGLLKLSVSGAVMVDILPSLIDRFLLAQDVIAVPVGPRVQRVALAAAPSYLAHRGVPAHPRDLLGHDCIRLRFSSGALVASELERDGEVLVVDPPGRLIIGVDAAPAAIELARAGRGIIGAFQNWMDADLQSGTLTPVLDAWWQAFEGPTLYFPSRLMSEPLRAFVDLVAADRGSSDLATGMPAG